MIEVEKHVNSNLTFYYIKGTQILHREDGPALISISGTKEWWINGKIHRDDGPAKEYRTGKKEWYLNGQYFDSKEFWFEALPEDKKLKMIYSEYFIRG
jgi:hypothetical protein